MPKFDSARRPMTTYAGTATDATAGVSVLAQGRRTQRKSYSEKLFHLQLNQDAADGGQ